MLPMNRRPTSEARVAFKRAELPGDGIMIMIGGGKWGRAAPIVSSRLPRGRGRGFRCPATPRVSWYRSGC